MSVLLDSNACIAVMNGNPFARTKFKHARQFDAPLFLSSISLFELWYGVVKSTRVAANTTQLNDFLEAIEILDFDDQDAYQAAVIRTALFRQGRSLGAYDLLIAAQAIRHDLMLVTADRDFHDLEALRRTDWIRKVPDQ